MIGEMLAVNVDDQNLDVLPAPFLQLLELVDAGFDGLASDGRCPVAPDRTSRFRRNTDSTPTSVK
jgi:hypothetical protein